MTILDIKNLSTTELLRLLDAINKELKFREEVGKDITQAKELKDVLEKELTEQETMSDRVIVRSELNQVKKDIDKMEKQRAVSSLVGILKKKPIEEHSIQEHDMTWGKEYEDERKHT
jgi:hypothetical protein|tara:strand:+ start:1348 stop:1698 length:351 start_codon:yes stop_codon:yes gene_type:complete